MKWVAAVVVVAAALGGLLALRSKPAARAMHFAIPLRAEISHLALSRDGSMLAFVSPDETTGKNVLYVQAIGAEQPTALAGTDGATYPFWSPDGQYVGFFAESRLMKVRASGGPPQALATVSPSPRGGSWGSKGVIVYNSDAGGFLSRVNADGTGAAPLTEKLATPTEGSHRWPMFLPDGEHFLFWAGNWLKEGTVTGIYMSSIEGKERKQVVQARSNMGYAQPGYLFYVDDETGKLLIQNFDASTGKLGGDARAIADVVGFQPSLFWGAFAVAESGTVVWNASTASSQSVLTWMDRTGKVLGTVGKAGTMFNPALSPDGQRVAVDIADLKAVNVDVWVDDLAHGTATRFTFDPAEETTPVWSPDGTHIAFRTSRRGTVLKAANGLEKERVIAASPTAADDVYPTSFSPDGKLLVCELRSGHGGGRHIGLAKMGDPKPVQLLASKGSETNGQISPDGKWLAYASDESGAWEIYVTTFPGAAGKWQVSQGEGSQPRWRGDGKELFYLGAKGTLTAVPISADTTFSSGAPLPLFQVQTRAPISSTDRFSYDVTQDGQKFIVNRYAKPAYVTPLDIVLNATSAAEGKK
jgi:Tol biopolymer transport system component